MTPEQARAAHCAYDRLCDYLTSDAAIPVPSHAALGELTYGNFLAAETLAGVLSRLRGKTFDEVLDDLPERDEGYPPGPAAKYMWETAVYQLRYLHAHTWQRRSEPSHVYDPPTAFRSSFNLVLATVIEVAAETQTTAHKLTGMLRDAAAAAVTQADSV